MGTGDEHPEPEEITLGKDLTLSALVTFPAATACVLGVVYAMGSVTRSAELSHAGVPVTAAFPLIPIPQELARGIQIFVSPGVLVLIPILALTLVVFESVLAVPARPVTPSGWRAKVNAWLETKHGKVFVSVLALVVLGVGIFWRPLDLASILLALATVLVFLMLAAPGGRRHRFFRHRFRISSSLATAALVLGVAVASVFNELVNPQPLAHATLYLDVGAPIRGPFVALADGNWYVGAPGSQLRVVDARTVRLAVIVAVPRPRDRLQESIFDLIG